MKVLVEGRSNKQKKIIGDTSGEGFKVNKEYFNIVMNKFRSKDTKTYDFFSERR